MRSDKPRIAAAPDVTARSAWFLSRPPPAAIAAEAWDEAGRLIGQIQARDKNYRDVAKLAKTVQRRRRQERWQRYLVLPAPLKRLPGVTEIVVREARDDHPRALTIGLLHLNGT